MSSIVANRTGSSKPVFWSTSSDAEIVQALEDAYAGKIDLEEDYGWAVGDRRKVKLTNGTNVTFVLLNKGGYTLTSGGSCKYVVGLLNFLYNSSMNSSATNSGSWSSSSGRNWCNSTFRNLVPTTLRPAFNQFKCVTGTYNGTAAGGTNQTTNDYFALPCEKEVTYAGYSTTNEQGANFLFSYYMNTPTVKYQGDPTSAVGPYGAWWLRSPAYYISTDFVCMDKSSSSYYDLQPTVGSANLSKGMCPFGCI